MRKYDLFDDYNLEGTDTTLQVGDWVKFPNKEFRNVPMQDIYRVSDIMPNGNLVILRKQVPYEYVDMVEVDAEPKYQIGQEVCVKYQRGTTGKSIIWRVGDYYLEENNGEYVFNYVRYEDDSDRIWQTYPEYEIEYAYISNEQRMKNYNPRDILKMSTRLINNEAILDLYKYFDNHPDIPIDDYRDILSSYQGNGGNPLSNDRGILDEYYTPEYICEHIYNLAKKYGYNHGNILEPSCAVGRLIRPFYEKKDYNAIEAFEINITSRNICKMLYPEVELHEGYFETAFLEWPRFRSVAKKTWLKYADFDLVVGNPPFGKHNNKYAGIFSKKQSFSTIDIFFIYYGLTLLKKGGLLIYVLPTSILSTGGDYTKDKERIAEIADFVDAYRLPQVFKNTSISTDILVLRRK